MDSFKLGLQAATAAVLMVSMLGGCSEGSRASTTSGKTPVNIARELTVSTAALTECGLEAASPQVFVFRDAELAGTEYGYSPGQPLNIANNAPGPLADSVDELASCIAGAGGALEQWKACKDDYCVVNLLPAPSLGECPFCDSTQSGLETFFANRNATVSYYTLFYTE